MAQKQSYNLPGFGFMRIRLFPCALKVFDFLEQYEHVSRLKQIDQLGPIRDVLPGAHHTRYEYLMAQLALITELCQLKGTLPTGMSLSRDRDTFGLLTGISGAPSNAEILMVLALLGNIGHLPTTFSGERAILKYLRDNLKVRRLFRSGLPAEDQGGFEEVVGLFDLYRFNHYIAIFLLNRYRRREDGNEVVAFCQSILRSYLARDADQKDQSIIALWRLYRNIRRLTYVALDSHYAPVPFSLDLASIFFNLEDYLADVFIDGSTFQDALARLEEVLRDTVYLAPRTLLNHARVSDSVLLALEDRSTPLDSIGALWDLLRPDRAALTFSTEADDSFDELLPALIVSLDYQLDPVAASRAYPDPPAWERRAHTAVGLRSCRFGSEFDPGKQNLKVAAALSPGLEPSLAYKISLRISKQLLDLDLGIRRHIVVAPHKDSRNGMAMLRFLLTSALGSTRDFRLTAKPVSGRTPVVWEYGSTKLSHAINSYLIKARDGAGFTPDEMNEIAMLRDALVHVTYRGGVIAFAGSTVVLERGESCAEFDGVAFLLSREIDEPTMMVVEAKNLRNGHRVAGKQIEKQMEKLGIGTGFYKVQYLGTKGAYARLRLPAA